MAAHLLPPVFLLTIISADPILVEPENVTNSAHRLVIQDPHLLLLLSIAKKDLHSPQRVFNRWPFYTGRLYTALNLSTFQFSTLGQATKPRLANAITNGEASIETAAHHRILRRAVSSSLPRPASFV
ncbi:hypothetical protein LMH87_001932 [Akanthomyces muscarius]|uniref:Secreted protein n=1 Tax=Akanthomyces muscarius TaxID=2231603 RepID=A0A9W8UGL9_AKAMU|nr:hypothetical protein LMH87_001932 [Akanthomyces muscarius]KAJ4147411.1 hypothetical protein LMH87_001932 [Akanthomyces muscarius]